MPDEMVLSFNWIYRRVSEFRELVVVAIYVWIYGDDTSAKNGRKSKQDPDAGIAIVHQAVCDDLVVSGGKRCEFVGVRIR